MSSILVNALRLVIYPNDHGPPHVHVLGPGRELKVRLKDSPVLVSILGKPKNDEISKGIEAVQEYLWDLTSLWGDLHG
jgi:hypothetical protein